jgi:hypothetical protein
MDDVVEIKRGTRMDTTEKVFYIEKPKKEMD